MDGLSRPFPAEFDGPSIKKPIDPTDAFTIQSPLHDVSELHKIRRSPEVEALKL